MHKPVLLSEVVSLMGIRPGGAYIDGTVGGGGHSAAILEQAGPDGRLLGLDRDVEALGRARERLAAWGSACELVYGDFADMIAIAKQYKFESVDGVLLDLGMSSDQVDTPDRGFSFLQDGPLDMRMDRSQAETAQTLVNRLDERELADLLWTLGEESASRRIAKAIVDARSVRPIGTTGELAEIVSAAAGGRRGRIHPATKTFQALRIAVNHELESIEAGLESAFSLVKPGGRIAVISFHSLEDRIVKHAFARHVGRFESLQAGGRRWVGEAPAARWITKKPVTASESEMAENPRARSAKLRIVERLD